MKMNFKRIKKNHNNLISYIFITMDEERFKIIDAINFK